MRVFRGSLKANQKFNTAEHPGAAVTFVLIKEKKYPEDDFSAYFSSFATREEPQNDRRSALELWR